MVCHLDCGDFVDKSGSRVNIDELKKLQNRLARCIEYCLYAYGPGRLVSYILGNR